ncbi:MAG: gamma carbonic anhydrase family protein [Sedimentisphaerales bacterium]|nr:gamma carbonic anhydrase family protein [Sedimentisphaerales bacterium]
MLYEFDNHTPQIHPSAFIAPTATVIGSVTIAQNSSVWFHCVIRGDDSPIYIAEQTNIQDLSTLHGATRQPLRIGSRVTVGHRCILHGCTIEDDCLIGMGAIIMTGAYISRGSIVAAGSVVKENTTIPPLSLAAGVPAQVVRTYKEHIIDRFQRPAANHYLNRLKQYQNPQTFNPLSNE